MCNLRRSNISQLEPAKTMFQEPELVVVPVTRALRFSGQHLGQITVNRLPESMAMAFINQPRLPAFDVGLGAPCPGLCVAFGLEAAGKRLAASSNMGW